MNIEQLRQLISDVLSRMDLHLKPSSPYCTPEAIDLILGTACVESDCAHYIEQINGPALGIFQMEVATHDDIWHNYINHRQKIKVFMRGEIGETLLPVKSDSLRWNLSYAIMMTRLHYRRVSEPIPVLFNEPFEQGDYDDGLLMLANYWKAYYNTHKGKGSIEDFITKWRKHND